MFVALPNGNHGFLRHTGTRLTRVQVLCLRAPESLRPLLYKCLVNRREPKAGTTQTVIETSVDSAEAKIEPGRTQLDPAVAARHRYPSFNDSNNYTRP